MKDVEISPNRKAFSCLQRMCLLLLSVTSTLPLGSLIIDTGFFRIADIYALSTCSSEATFWLTSQGGLYARCVSTPALPFSFSLQNKGRKNQNECQIKLCKKTVLLFQRCNFHYLNDLQQWVNVIQSVELISWKKVSIIHLSNNRKTSREFTQISVLQQLHGLKPHVDNQLGRETEKK